MYIHCLPCSDTRKTVLLQQKRLHDLVSKWSITSKASALGLTDEELNTIGELLLQNAAWLLDAMRETTPE